MSKNPEIPTMSLVLEITNEYLDAFAAGLLYRLVFCNLAYLLYLAKAKKHEHAAFR